MFKERLLENKTNRCLRQLTPIMQCQTLVAILLHRKNFCVQFFYKENDKIKKHAKIIPSASSLIYSKNTFGDFGGFMYA